MSFPHTTWKLCLQSPCVSSSEEQPAAWWPITRNHQGDLVLVAHPSSSTQTFLWRNSAMRTPTFSWSLCLVTSLALLISLGLSLHSSLVRRALRPQQVEMEASFVLWTSSNAKVRGQQICIAEITTTTSSQQTNRCCYLFTMYSLKPVCLSHEHVCSLMWSTRCHQSVIISSHPCYPAPQWWDFSVGRHM